MRYRVFAALPSVLLLTGALAPTAQPQARSDEGNLIVMLLRTRIQIERIQSDIEIGEQEIEANRRIIETAETAGVSSSLSSPEEHPTA